MNPFPRWFYYTTALALAGSSHVENTSMKLPPTNKEVRLNKMDELVTRSTLARIMKVTIVVVHGCIPHGGACLPAGGAHGGGGEYPWLKGLGGVLELQPGWPTGGGGGQYPAGDGGGGHIEGSLAAGDPTHGITGGGPI
jgi:hypothetical protein